MPEHIRALIVVLVVSSVVWVLVRPVAVQIIPRATFARWRVLWYVTTLAWFLAHNYWVYVALMTVVLLSVGRREAHVFGLYLLLLVTVPPSGAWLPGLGVADNLFRMDQARLLALALLLPCALRLSSRRVPPNSHRSLVDTMVIGFLLLNTVLAFRTGVTDGVRIGVLVWLDYFLPYYVASRSIEDREGLRHAMAGLLLGGILLSMLAVIEVLRSWRVYDSASVALGLHSFGQYKSRGGFLRPIASIGDPIVLGYVITVATGAYLYLQNLVPDSMRRWAVWAVLLIGVFMSLSRGPWVGAAFLFMAFVLVSPRPIKRFVQSGVVAVGLLIALSGTSIGQQVISLLPYFGTEEQGNIEYREDLLTASKAVIWRHPYFGSSDFAETPELEAMRQGEGIIDIVNNYLVVTLHSGFVGLGLFVGMFLCALLAIRRGMRLARQAADEDSLKIGRALFASVVSVMFIIFTVSGIYVVPTIYFMLIGICRAYLMSQPASGRTKLVNAAT